ncbi:hypothetical protein ACFL1T_01850 [Chlamydiota bacterium]
MKKGFRINAGFSVLAVAVFMLLFSLVAAFLVSLISTTIATSANELASTKALYIAEGGLDAAIRWMKEYNLTNYGVLVDEPNNTVLERDGYDTAFAGGAYTVNPRYSLTALYYPPTGNITDNETIAVVYSTSGFDTSGILKIDDEEMYYTDKTTTTFTGLIRGFNGTPQQKHGHNSIVYPATSLTAAIDATTETIPVLNTQKFLPRGKIKIGDELIHYTIKNGTSFLYCIRGAKIGTLESTATAHPAGSTVTPGVQQCQMTVIATVGTTEKVGYAKRIVRVTFHNTGS